MYQGEALAGCENVARLTRPTLARRDVPFPSRRSRIIQGLNGSFL
jgi:hypothetical protein